MMQLRKVMPLFVDHIVMPWLWTTDLGPMI
jgi:hypothetical protein